MMNSKILTLLGDLSKNRILNELRKEFPTLDRDLLLKIYNKSISIRQSNVQKNGSDLEEVTEKFLELNNIPFKRQVVIDKDGIIVERKKEKCDHILDIVVGENINYGSNISNFKVLSCKTTCRERWTQDSGWSMNNPPRKYILVTLTSDYPPSSRFVESDQRKILTCVPKSKDDRKYKLSFDNLLEEL